MPNVQLTLRHTAAVGLNAISTILSFERVDDSEFLEERVEKDGDVDVKIAAATLFVLRSNRTAHNASREVKILGYLPRGHERPGFCESAGKLREVTGNYRGAAKQCRKANLESEIVLGRAGFAKILGFVAEKQ